MKKAMIVEKVDLKGEQYRKEITKNIVIDMVEEILGCLDMIDNDVDRKRSDLLNAHENLFVGTVEEELDIEDKIIMYAYAKERCSHIIKEKNHSKNILKKVKKWYMRLEKRIQELKNIHKRTGIPALINAYNILLKNEAEKKHPNKILIKHAIELLNNLTISKPVQEMKKHTDNEDRLVYLRSLSSVELVNEWTENYTKKYGNYLDFLEWIEGREYRN